MNESLSKQDIAFERRGVAGLVTLQRPRALNALTLDMVRRLHAHLDEWADDPAICCVVIRSSDDRSFCAGGDIRTLYDLGTHARYEDALAFWREEYALNCRIKRYPKPYIALIDGIVMGGGVGISLHGSHRMAGPGYAFAMPEVGIGFFPDVGATWALPRLPGRTGTWLALTGARVAADDACRLGLATDRVVGGCFEEILGALSAGDLVENAVKPWRIEAAPTQLDAQRAIIDECFDHHTVESILLALDDASVVSSFAADAAAAMRAHSPMSLLIAREQMRRGRGLDFEEAMRTEFRIVSRIVHGQDFYEGVRAMIIDKDRKPAWFPAKLEAIDPSTVCAYFEPLEVGEFKPDSRSGA